MRSDETVSTSEWLDRILPCLEVVRGPDKRGEHIAWCPFHADGQGQPRTNPICMFQSEDIFALPVGPKGD